MKRLNKNSRKGEEPSGMPSFWLAKPMPQQGHLHRLGGRNAKGFQRR